ncbi:MAG: glycoside hydrolase family 25 protein [Bacteroidaceae bacterium]|nr:glycoside hydrolase family 25 protein [Bacteroidaceae bacterium]
MVVKKKTQKKKNSKKGKKQRRSFFRRMPSYILWSLIAVIAVIYITAFYNMFVSPYSFRWKALYGDEDYPAGTVRGIDISHYQDEIDWDLLRNATVKDSPLMFIFVKATEGVGMLDENFIQNFYYARQNSIMRGAYHYFKPQSSVDKQARFFCKCVQLEEDDLPPVLDVEEDGGLSKEQLQKAVLKWLKIVEKHYGVKPILYCSYSFRRDILTAKEFDDYPLWIANYYVDKLSYKGDWKFWQHTDFGRVAGIKGNVDVNLFNGSREELWNMRIGNNQNADFNNE